MRARIEALLTGAGDAAFRHWLGSTLTEQKPNIALLPPDPPWPAAEVAAALGAAGRLWRDGASRLLYLRADDPAAADLLFANGECLDVPRACAGFLPILCRRPALEALDAAPWLTDPDCVALLARLFNEGHFLPPDSPHLD
jgi:ribosomal protein L16 Arg81 hydroxylase